jgi:hypothetical protein
MVRDAVRCHYEEGEAPKLVRLHHVRDELLAVCLRHLHPASGDLPDPSSAPP